MLLEDPRTPWTNLSCEGFINPLARLIRARYTFIKRVSDVIISVAALLICMPFMIIFGSIIKLTSRGPVFYTQTRIGEGGKPFNLIKFRTMRVNAEDETGPVWATSEDPRVTKIGYYLRKLHLDEIPQFINILKGEMSVVGPRPERPVFVDVFKRQIQGYPQRLMVKPGLTGLAQVRYKYDETLEDVKNKLTYDIFYIKRMCLFMDCKIFLWTVGKILSILMEFFRTKRPLHGCQKHTAPIMPGFIRQQVFSS